MNKEGYIKYWIKTSASDWNAVKQLYNGRSYLQSLFFAHLAIEKLCKAVWIRDNQNNHPPRIHNLHILLKSSKLQLSEDQMTFVILMNDFQLEGRYPDYAETIYKRCNSKYTRKILDQANSLRLWLLKNLR